MKPFSNTTIRRTIARGFRPVAAGVAMLAMAAAAPHHRAEAADPIPIPITIEILTESGASVAPVAAWLLTAGPAAPRETGIYPVSVPAVEGAEYTVRIVVADPPPIARIPGPVGLPHAVFALQVVADVRR